MLKEYKWNKEKNEKLVWERGISFEIVLNYIEKNQVIDIVQHPNQEKYPKQQIYLIEIEDYIYMVPFVMSETEIFLKTIIPSRKVTRDRIKKGKNNEKNKIRFL